MHHLSVRLVPTSIGDFVCKNTRILFIFLIVKESPKACPNNYLISISIIPLPISHQIIQIRQFVRITIAAANQQFSYCPIHQIQGIRYVCQQFYLQSITYGIHDLGSADIPLSCLEQYRRVAL